MTRVRCILIAGLLFIVALGLPLYFLEERSGRLRCHGGSDYEHCVAGTPYTLVLPLGLEGRGYEFPYADLYIASYIRGIYARRGYSARAAEIYGLAVPFLLLCAAGYLTFRAVRKPKTAT